MWFQDYSKRFFQCTRGDQALSPPWDQDDDALLKNQAIHTGNDHSADPRLMMMADNNQSYHGHHSNFGFGFDFDMKEAIPLGPLPDNNRTLNKVEYANAQMGLKWQSCEFYVSIFSLTYICFIPFF